MLRNPVDVVYSLHSQHLYDGNEDIQDFETALSFDEDRKRGIHLPDSVDYFELPPYKDSVLFSNQVKRYLDVFGRENVHVLLHEDLKANAEKTFFKVLEFLGVSKQILINYGIVNPGKQIKSFFVHRVIKKPPLKLKTVVRFMIPSQNIRHFIMSFFFKWNIKQGKREDMFLVMIIGVYKKRQETFLQGFIQSSFLVYVFMVLTLTGYFMLFREVAAQGWWHRVLHRIHTKERINLHPFLMFKQFQIGSTQVVGNLVMLLPLGIYIPLLYPKFPGFLKVFIICLFVSISIELMQLITSVRSTDIDDVILNTSGAIIGYVLYKLFRLG